jgi:hypothetical protein
VTGHRTPNKKNNPEYIVPSVFDKSVAEAVAHAVEESAYQTRVARRDRNVPDKIRVICGEVFAMQVCSNRLLESASSLELQDRDGIHKIMVWVPGQRACCLGGKSRTPRIFTIPNA